jgi:hypothetical protein
MHVDQGGVPTFLNLTMVDRMNRWLEAVQLVTFEVDAWPYALINTWVSHVGFPGNITLDQARQFPSILWAHLSQALGKHNGTTAAYQSATSSRDSDASYHPQASCPAHSELQGLPARSARARRPPVKLDL